MTFDSISLEHLRKRRSAKWSMYGDDILPSFYVEMDFPLPPVIVEALTAAMECGDLDYAHASGAGLGEAFARFAQRRWAWEVSPDDVAAVPDVMVGVAELLRILTSPNGSVVINTPVYQPFFTVIAETGRQVVEIPMLKTRDGWRLPLEGIRQAFVAGAEALLFCNPHNPTGYAANRDELLMLANIVVETNALVLSDEIHAPLTLAGARHTPLCSVSARARNHAIVLTSASKAWNVAGLKCGLAIAQSTPMRDALAALPVELPDRVGHLGVLAAVAAFTNGEAWLDELLTYLDETRHWLPGLLADRLPGIAYEPGQATYLAWLDCRALGLGDDPAVWRPRNVQRLDACPQNSLKEFGRRRLLWFHR